MRSFISAAIAIPFVVVQIAAAQVCERDPKLQDFGQWMSASQIQSGKEYSASATRRSRIEQKYSALKLGMTRSEVSELIGTPDYESIHSSVGARLGDKPAPYQRCDYQWAYVLNKKDDNPFSSKDSGLYLMFSSGGKLLWVSPQGLNNLKPIGSPVE